MSTRPIPVRVKALIERWISGGRFGTIALNFKAGGITSVDVSEHLTPQELEPPELVRAEPEKVTP